VLQAVEDALIDAGYDDFMVATDHGTFRWRAVESARGNPDSPPEPRPGVDDPGD
jgi:hypothetical protein